LTAIGAFFGSGVLETLMIRRSSFGSFPFAAGATVIVPEIETS
jgi:hypothetical protein